MRKILYLLPLLFALLLPVSASALDSTGIEGKDYYTWYGTTASNIVVGWDHPEHQAIDTFEVQIKNVERNSIVKLAETKELKKEFKCPKTGHWVVQVRTKRLVGTEMKYSDWVDSTNSTLATVNNQPRGWWIFAWIAGTGNITVGELEETQTGNHKNVVLSFNSFDEMDKYFADLYK